MSPKTGGCLARFEILPVCVRILILSPSRFELYHDVFREGRGNFGSVLLSSLACVFMITGLWHIHCGHLTFKSGYFNEANYLNLYSCIFLFCIQKIILSSGYERRFHNFLFQPRNPQLKRNFMPRPIGHENGAGGLEARCKAPVTWSPAPPGGSAKEHSLEKHLVKGEISPEVTPSQCSWNKEKTDNSENLWIPIRFSWKMKDFSLIK